MQFLARIDRGLQTSAARALDCSEEALDLRIEWRRLFQIDRMAGIRADPQACLGKHGLQHQVRFEGMAIVKN
jgi:hypothetical protein